MDYKSDVADYDLIFGIEKPLAYGVFCTDAAYKKNAIIWFPKSQVEWVAGSCIRGRTCTLTIPEWLAEKHDLL